jgi:hypothetical protein
MRQVHRHRYHQVDTAAQANAAGRHILNLAVRDSADTFNVSQDASSAPNIQASGFSGQPEAHSPGAPAPEHARTVERQPEAQSSRAPAAEHPAQLQHQAAPQRPAEQHPAEAHKRDDEKKQ